MTPIDFTPAARTSARASAPRHHEVIVVGAGQAGLAAGYFLRRARTDFAILDGNAAVGDSWRTRWDSLRLFTPSRYNALPGLSFPGPAYELPGKDDVARFLASYAREFDLPIELDTRVGHLRHDAGRFVVTTHAGAVMTASAVIIATGANQRPHVPEFAARLDPGIVQVHSSAYRRPGQLPPGRVLVVGAGNSGAQIALELAGAGREVVLSGPDTGALPRRFLGRDLYDWLWPTLLRPSIESRIGRRLMAGRVFSGDPLIGIDAKKIARPGLTRAGRAIGTDRGWPVLEGNGALGDVAAVVWCTGFRPDYGWIELPAFGLDGYPAHRRGLARHVPGLAFLGMRFQFRIGSSLLGGVGEDAEFVVQRILADHASKAGRIVQAFARGH